MLDSSHVNICFEKCDDRGGQRKCRLCNRKIQMITGEDDLAILHLASSHAESFVLEHVKTMIAIDFEIEAIAKSFGDEAKSPRPNEGLLKSKAETFVRDHGVNTRDTKVITLLE